MLVLESHLDLGNDRLMLPVEQLSPIGIQRLPGALPGRCHLHRSRPDAEETEDVHGENQDHQGQNEEQAAGLRMGGHVEVWSHQSRNHANVARVHVH
jgi:hypothetical protein